MRLVLLGGGGFRVPLVHRALLDDEHAGRVDELVLHDVDEGRLGTMTRVLAQQGAGAPRPVTVRATARIDEALEGADFIFSAIRVGGLSGRTLDERIALDHAVLGQETVGAGGISYGLRTVPVAVGIAERIAPLAPDAAHHTIAYPAGPTPSSARHSPSGLPNTQLTRPTAEREKNNDGHCKQPQTVRSEREYK